jgi:peptidoglycan hydrolase CwlO-like protein
MRKSFLPILILAVILPLMTAGCATTGDPKAGGLFGWSEAKAKDRQTAAKAALAQEEKKGEELRAEKQRLQGQIKSKQGQLEALKKKTAASPSGLSSSEAAEISRLEREIDQLQQEALILMDL